MERYKISIIVPVYNVERYLERCVRSLTGQIYHNLEILLVDDGSKDGSGTLCDTLAQQDKRIRVIHKENGGLISAWKAGVLAANGEYLHFVDSDDWIDPEALAEMAMQLTGINKEIISSDYVIERQNGQQYIWQKLLPGEYTGERLSKEVIPEILGNEERYVCLSRCMKLISRELVETNMHYSDPAIRMGEDITVMVPALIDCERLVIMDHKAYYHYWYMDSSMVHKYDSKLYENMLRLREILVQIIEDKFRGDEKAVMLLQAQKEYIYLMFLVLKNEARGNPRGHRKNIRSICKESGLRELVIQCPITVEQKANKLLYAVMKHPNGMMVMLLRLAVVLYYRK